MLQAPTGSGKSSVLPWLLREFENNQECNIAVLQPRRIAAKSVANFLAKSLGGAPGHLVGYKFRFEDCTSPHTRICFWTYGSFFASVVRGGIPPNISWIILDEFHERRVEMDLLLAWLMAWQATNCKAPRLAVLSAGLNRESLEKYLGITCLTLQVPTHPVALAHQEARSNESLAQQVLRALLSLQHSGFNGTNLVFLPGKGEISACQRLLEERWPRQEVEILSLFAGQEEDLQQQVFEETSKPRVILATNIAETSITIPGVTGVVDSGWERSADDREQIAALRLQRISMQNALQRMGRAGRTAPGACVRLWSDWEETKFQQENRPELLRTRLDNHLLALGIILENCGIPKKQLQLLDYPPADAWQNACQKLHSLNLIIIDGDEFRVTDLGRRITQIPLQSLELAVLMDKFPQAPTLLGTICIWLENPPHTGVGQSRNLLEIAANIRPNGEAGKQWLKLESWMKFRRTQLSNGTHRQETEPPINFASTKTNPDNEPLQWCQQLLLQYFPQNLAGLTESGRAFKLADGTAVPLLPEQVGEPFALLFAMLRTGNKVAQCLFVPIPKNLLITPTSQEIQIQACWKENRLAFVPMRLHYFQGRESAREEILPGQGNAQEMQRFREDLPRAWQELLTSQHLERLWMDEENSTLIRKMQLAAELFPEHKFPIWNKEDHELVLWECTTGISKQEELNPARFRTCAEEYFGNYWIPWLKKTFPDQLTLANGKSARYSYPSKGAVELRARVADFFGMRGEHRIAENRLRVLYDILAPNYRTTQKTWDLTEFWRSTYPQVRKELRGRYPRHPWPEEAP